MDNINQKDRLPKAIASSKETPLKLGEVKIDCYVLDDEQGTAVLSFRGAAEALGLGTSDGKRLIRFVNSKVGKSIFLPQSINAIDNPVKFLTDNNSVANGITAVDFIKLCVAIKNSDFAPVELKKISQLIVDASAVIGITAMIYEATGYEKKKSKEAFQNYFKYILADEAAKWECLFNESGFLDDLAKMRGIEWAKPGCYPLYFGKLINEFVYSKILPGLELELDSRNPTLANKHRRYRHHQFFQENGRKVAKQHLDRLHTLAVASNYDFDMFKMLVDRVYPNKANNQ